MDNRLDDEIIYVKLEYENLLLSAFAEVSKELNLTFRKAIEYETKESLRKKNLRKKKLIKIVSVEKGSFLIELTSFLISVAVIVKTLRSILSNFNAILDELDKLMERFLKREDTNKLEKQIEYLTSLLHHIYNLSKLAAKEKLKIAISIRDSFPTKETIFIDQRTYDFLNRKAIEGILYTPSEFKVNARITKLERFKTPRKIGNHNFIAKATALIESDLSYEIFIEQENHVKLLSDVFKSKSKVSLTIKPFIDIKQYAKPNKAKLLSIN